MSSLPSTLGCDGCYHSRHNGKLTQGFQACCLVQLSETPSGYWRRGSTSVSRKRCSGCCKRRSAKGVLSFFFVFGTLSVTFSSFFHVSVIFFVTFPPNPFLPDSFCVRCLPQSSLKNGSSKPLVLEGFSGEGTLWNSSLLVCHTFRDTPALCTPLLLLSSRTHKRVSKPMCFIPASEHRVSILVGRRTRPSLNNAGSAGRLLQPAVLVWTPIRRR